mmetsp:Transcript_32092/g.56332  ORF Transcript_32092/g.56332 Transcript_32092/m.56332 type:complete len:263 (-) Transcript_32092:285-1073(-)
MDLGDLVQLRVVVEGHQPNAQLPGALEVVRLLAGVGVDDVLGSRPAARNRGVDLRERRAVEARAQAAEGSEQARVGVALDGVERLDAREVLLPLLVLSLHERQIHEVKWLGLRFLRGGLDGKCGDERRLAFEFVGTEVFPLSLELGVDRGACLLGERLSVSVRVDRGRVFVLAIVMFFIDFFGFGGGGGVVFRMAGEWGVSELPRRLTARQTGRLRLWLSVSVSVRVRGRRKRSKVSGFASPGAEGSPRRGGKEHHCGGVRE